MGLGPWARAQWARAHGPGPNVPRPIFQFFLLDSLPDPADAADPSEPTSGPEGRTLPSTLVGVLDILIILWSRPIDM